MKINECAVIDNKVIDELIAECLHPEVYKALLHIKQHLTPLEPIVRDAYFFIEDYLNELTPADFNDYINENEI
jgi:hypothetical protein